MSRKKIRTFFPWCLSALLFLVLGSGCASPRKSPVYGPDLGIKVAVMDFQAPETMTSTKRIEGWWFGAKDVLENPNMGKWVADALSRSMNRVPNLTTVPRVLIKYYFADKTDLLKQTYARDFTDQELLTLLYQAPADRFAQELEADYILRGIINECYTARNRTIDTFWSYIDMNVELVDSRSGNVVWTGAVQKRKMWHSQLSTAELAIEDLLVRLDREFFLVE